MDLIFLWENAVVENLFFCDSPFNRAMDFFHKMCWNREQSDSGIALPEDTEPSVEHGPEQTHVIGPAQSRESDLNFPEPTYIILCSVMQRMARGLL